MLTTLINPAIFEEGYKEGYKEGFKEGFRCGFTEGFKRGFTEGYKDSFKKSKLEVEKNMLMEGLVVPSIIKITGLAEEEILKLKVELENVKP